MATFTDTHTQQTMFSVFDAEPLFPMSIAAAAAASLFVLSLCLGVQLEGVKIRSLEEYEKRLYSQFDTEEEVGFAGDNLTCS